MAYNDEGQWIGFHPEFDTEDRDALDNVDRNEMARQYRMAEANNASYQETINQTTAETLKELDISMEEWQAINQELPVESHKKNIARGTQKYVKKTVAAAKRKKQGKQAQQPQASKPKPEAVGTARQKLDEGGRLSESDELAVLGAVLGSDFNL